MIAPFFFLLVLFCAINWQRVILLVILLFHYIVNVNSNSNSDSSIDSSNKNQQCHPKRRVDHCLINEKREEKVSTSVSLRMGPAPIKWWRKTPKQRRFTQYIKNHPQLHVISIRGRTWIIIFWFQKSSIHTQDTQKARPSATTNAYPNGQ